MFFININKLYSDKIFFNFLNKKFIILYVKLGTLGQDINGNTQEKTGRSLAVSGDGTTLAMGAQRFNNAKGQVEYIKV